MHRRCRPARPPLGNIRLLDLGLRRHQVTRHQDVLVEVAEGHLDPFLTDGDDRGLVLGFALVVLLAVGEAGVGVGRHGDPRLRPVDSRLERIAVTDDLAILVVGDVLAEVPDVPGVVLGVPVLGDLDRRSVLGDRVAYHAGLDPVGYHLRLVGDLDNDLLVRALYIRLAVDPPGARTHRPVGVVDADREAGRVELYGPPSLRQVSRLLAPEAVELADLAALPGLLSFAAEAFSAVVLGPHAPATARHIASASADTPRIRDLARFPSIVPPLRSLPFSVIRARRLFPTLPCSLGLIGPFPRPTCT